jgi:hypothetical protein
VERSKNARCDWDETREFVPLSVITLASATTLGIIPGGTFATLTATTNRKLYLIVSVAVTVVIGGETTNILLIAATYSIKSPSS